jgi:taurine dioxygenase
MGRTVRHGLATASAGNATRHPLFRRHPVTNEVALFLSTPERCSDLSGLEPARSARAIDALYRHSIRPANLYNHLWRPGDIVLWDDRLTMHRADHAGVSGDRVLHRGLVVGERPIAAA